MAIFFRTAFIDSCKVRSTQSNVKDFSWNYLLDNEIQTVQKVNFICEFFRVFSLIWTSKLLWAGKRVNNVLRVKKTILPWRKAIPLLQCWSACLIKIDIEGILMSTNSERLSKPTNIFCWVALFCICCKSQCKPGSFTKVCHSFVFSKRSNMLVAHKGLWS